MRSPFALLVLALLAAGCLDAGDDAVRNGPEDVDLPDLGALVADLPCEAPFDDVGTTENLRQLSLTEFDGESGPQDPDDHGALLLAARDMGFSTVDVSDPLLPVVLGHYGDAGGMLDVKFTPDNLTALVSSYDNIDLVDVRDPAEPRQVGRWTFDDAPSPPSGMGGQNAHMVFPARIAGEDWVFLAPQSSTGVWILRIVGTPAERGRQRHPLRPSQHRRRAPHRGDVHGVRDERPQVLGRHRPGAARADRVLDPPARPRHLRPPAQPQHGRRPAVHGALRPWPV